MNFMTYFVYLPSLYTSEFYSQFCTYTYGYMCTDLFFPYLVTYSVH